MSLETIAYIFVSILVISLVSLVGILTLSLKKAVLNRLLLPLVGFSIGALFGGAFLHLMPEAVEGWGFGSDISFFLLSGIVVFFIVEKFIHWHHCHQLDCDIHPQSFAIMNLVGDGVHNFIDGLVVAGTYIASIPVGIATTLAVIFHEIPQEIGDFGVLIKGGFSIKKALTFNFLTALTAFVGAVVAVILSGYVEHLESFLLPFTAGGFVYIAGSDLIPLLHKETKTSNSVMQLVAILLGIGVMYSLKFLG